MKKLSWFLAVGGVIGGALSTWLSPNMISWYFDPPAGFGISCKEPIVWALRRLQYMQLGGLVVGAVIGLLLSFKFRKKGQEATEYESLPQQ